MPFWRGTHKLVITVKTIYQIGSASHNIQKSQLVYGITAHKRRHAEEWERWSRHQSSARRALMKASKDYGELENLVLAHLNFHLWLWWCFDVLPLFIPHPAVISNYGQRKFFHLSLNWKTSETLESHCVEAFFLPFLKSSRRHSFAICIMLCKLSWKL